MLNGFRDLQLNENDFNSLGGNDVFHCTPKISKVSDSEIPEPTEQGILKVCKFGKVTRNLKYNHKPNCATIVTTQL